MRNHPFKSLPATAQTHFNLYCYAAILRVIDQVLLTYGSPEAAFERFPFLAGYLNELASLGLEGVAVAEANEWWHTAVADWAATVDGHLPLRALRQAFDLDDAALTELATIGLLEEDVRFGLVFETLQNIPGQHRPTLGLLGSWWRGDQARGRVRAALRKLQALGLIQVVNPEAPRLAWALQTPAAVWDVLRGEVDSGNAAYLDLTAWARYHPPAHLLAVADLIVPAAIQQAVVSLPGLLTAGNVRTVIVRGPQQNGRRTLLGVIARHLHLGVLELHGLPQPDDERWQLAGALASLLPALPVLVCDPAPGETVVLPALKGYHGPVGIVLGKQGGVRGPALEGAITLELPMPDGAARQRHWHSAFAACASPQGADDLACISERYRLTSGGIRQAARMATAVTAVAGRSTVTLADVRLASRSLNRQLLDTLAAPVATTGDWSQLAASPETLAELQNLEVRCRQREQLPTVVGAALAQQYNPGIRALLSGPSGTGKTLAARLLASALGMDLYRVDLSTVVNKYIGETEKNLSQLFARAEELDVILLLDEGDALLTQRTGVQSSNDRYANLETNYLLQRIESFEGILLVTTNAGERIDSAFQRRMDVVIDFRPPDAEERWAIWQLHLPVAHGVDYALLQDVAVRCILTGGQIRNAALHAGLLALGDGGVVTSDHVEVAVEREYRKAGGVCPLQPVYRYRNGFGQ